MPDALPESEPTAELYRVLAQAKDAQQAKASLDAISQLPDEQLLNEEEHRVVTVWWLAAIVAKTYALDSELAAANLTERFTKISLHSSGRIVSKSQAVIELLNRAISERDPQLLIDVGDHISQGWPGYETSAFPTALSELSALFYPAQLSSESLTNTSYVHWRHGLDAASAGDFATADRHFEKSISAYERLVYVSDVVWLYVDQIICALALGRVDDAVSLHRAQTRYVERAISQAPRADLDTLWSFDVISDDYSTFLDVRALGEQPLSARDRDILRRYVRVGEHLIRAADGSATDLTAAVDLFSFGWASFDQSPYPATFEQFANAVGVPLRQVNTSYRLWLDLLELPRVRPNSSFFFDRADDLERRLTRASLEDAACVAVLDAAVAGYMMYGRARALAWLEPRRYRPEEIAPALFSATAQALRTPAWGNHDQPLSIYISQRSGIAQPAFTSAIVSLVEMRRQTVSRNLSLRLTDNDFAVSGVSVYSPVPPVIGALLNELIIEFARARADGTPPDALSSVELASRLDLSLGAVTQAIHRLRTTLRKRFAEVLSAPLDDTAILQGRPGYRLNPVYVEVATTSFTGALDTKNRPTS